MSQVYYTKRVEGTEIPGIIHNRCYFFSRFSVYENGIVDCWHAVDLQRLKKEMDRGWVVPSVPVGESLSIFEVGDFEILQARWDYDKNGFYRHVQEVVRKLNPEMNNIYQFTPEEKEKWEKYRIVLRAEGVPFLVEKKVGYFTLDGSRKHTLYRKDGKLWLTALIVYKNKEFHIEMEDNSYSFEDIVKMIKEGRLYAFPKEGEWINIPGLGEIQVRTDWTKISDMERIKEIEEWCKRTVGEMTSHEKCEDAYFEYLKYPNEWSRKQLQLAYEAVPEHERIYLGDMDSKDWDIKRIIYHPEQKREV